MTTTLITTIHSPSCQSQSLNKVAVDILRNLQSLVQAEQEEEVEHRKASIGYAIQATPAVHSWDKPQAGVATGIADSKEVEGTAKYLVQNCSFRKGWTEGEEGKRHDTPTLQVERTASWVEQVRLQDNQTGLLSGDDTCSNASYGQRRCGQDIPAKVFGSHSNCMRLWRLLTEPWEVVGVNDSVTQRT